MKGEPFELFDSTVGLHRDGTSDLEANQAEADRRAHCGRAGHDPERAARRCTESISASRVRSCT